MITENGRIQLLRDLIAQNFDEIGRADGKANVLLATAAALLGLLLTRYPHQPGWAAWLWWAAAGGSASALLTLLLAVLPRHSTPAHGGAPALTYFEDVVRAGRDARLLAAIRNDGHAPEMRLLRALEGTSRIAHIKNRCLRWSIALLIPTVLASFGVLLPR